MRSIRSLLAFATAFAVSTLTISSVCAEAQSTSSTDQNRFELSASVSAGAQLSRGEVDKASLGMGSLTNQRPVMRGESLIATAPPKAMLPKEDSTGGFMQEYNVDWSGWIGRHADSWFQVLRSAEYVLGVQFQTPNAALIQFTCYADGTIGNVVLKQSSGVPAYDRLQIEALLAAVPTAPFPSGTKRRSITLTQGWESHPKRPGEEDFQLGSFGKDFPSEKVRQWSQPR